MTNVEKTSYFEVAPSGHAMPYKKVDNLFEQILMIDIYSNLLCNVNI